jgi:hypothetical protein
MKMTYGVKSIWSEFKADIRENVESDRRKA